jgi:hypothetical protein
MTGLAGEIEVIERQRHRSPIAWDLISPMQQVSRVEDNITRRYLHTAMHYREVMWIGKKANYFAAGLHRPDTQPRQTFLRALHPEPVQADLCQIGTEFSSCSWKQLQIRRANGGLIRKRVCERKYLAPGHHLSSSLDEVVAGPHSRENIVNRSAYGTICSRSRSTTNGNHHPISVCTVICTTANI